MTLLITYLTFNGNCREAMDFYRSCLGGELHLQTVGESPRSEGLPKRMKDSILHASLHTEKLVLMASDMVEGPGLIRGNAISILLESDSEQELKNCYERLAEGGRITHPIEPTHAGSLFGGLTDRFGNHWLFHLGKTKARSHEHEKQSL